MFSQPPKGLRSTALECGVRLLYHKVRRLPVSKREDTAGVRLRSHRKNASAAKPQEAVQADRHSSERKSLIFSIIPYAAKNDKKKPLQ